VIKGRSLLSEKRDLSMRDDEKQNKVSSDTIILEKGGAP